MLRVQLTAQPQGEALQKAVQIVTLVLITSLKMSQFKLNK